MTWATICCAVDFSEPSKAAFRVACELSARLGAKLTLFHADMVPGSSYPETVIAITPEMLADLSSQADRSLTDWKDQAVALGVKEVALARSPGMPAGEIARFAEDGHFDLVVLGTHGRTGLRRVLLGSVAEEVVRRCAVPVLTVPPSWRGESD
ncbi:universal stress protein [Anaeromyxobacter paludicola]|uniref:Universal stress protein n=1 Tax=Anaeromyxobacter paludicola TaxID=2918171 RepID=A0ABN6NDY8_9BACT|nr:universal stress protein [Anaeromyxobacter paludicola]BDG10260.1 universal stress protein UspA [Anaeromyxobacter paludicola]